MHGRLWYAHNARFIQVHRLGHLGELSGTEVRRLKHRHDAPHPALALDTVVRPRR